MKKTVNEVEFDPGYAPLVINSIGQAGYTYYIFSAIKDGKLKKLNFPHTLRKLEKYLKENIAFYLGCILWGVYISNIENAQITGNKLLGEDAQQEEYTSEIDFLIGLLEHDIQRDYKYCLGKNYEPDNRWLIILKAYREFLILNDGFCNCSNTNQIKLPSGIKKQSKKALALINSTIKKALENKDITILFDCYDTIF